MSDIDSAAAADDNLSPSHFAAIATAALERQRQNEWNSFALKLGTACLKAAQQGEFLARIQTHPKTADYIIEKLQSMGYMAYTIEVSFEGK